MATPFLGEVRIFSFGFAPQGWAFCNGQLLPISQNAALFSLLGTFYGGDGRETFALPNLQARIPIGQSNSFVLGESGGESNHTLSLAEIPAHGHHLNVGGTASETTPKDNYFATPNVNARLATLYSGASESFAASQTIESTGDTQSHLNTQPSLVLNYCIALQGIFPNRD